MASDFDITGDVWSSPLWILVVCAPQLVNTRYVNVKVFEVANGNCSSTNAVVISILNDTSPWQERLVHNDGNIEAYTALKWTFSNGSTLNKQCTFMAIDLAWGDDLILWGYHGGVNQIYYRSK
eukprot:scaffold4049_cov204-Alexandrium_tamarense.AAC.55